MFDMRPAPTPKEVLSAPTKSGASWLAYSKENYYRTFAVELRLKEDREKKSGDAKKSCPFEQNVEEDLKTPDVRGVLNKPVAP